MVSGNKIRINEYKSEYTTKLIGVYILQKLHLMVNSISTELGKINGGKFRMNYINVNHFIRLYDAYQRSS